MGTDVFHIYFGAFYNIPIGGFITYIYGDSGIYTTPPPPPGGGSGGATGRGGRPRRGAAARVKMDAPAWGLSLSMLTDSWRSPRSSTKNFGERDTTANGLL